ncbi:MAG TPA: hypothetical protein VJC18_02535, partial [bacterium]|nr:hypothetical protein [bacterium]
AVTRFVPVCKKNNLTFLRVFPLTGRTNQIRVHVNVAGGHILGDPLYGGQVSTSDQLRSDQNNTTQTCTMSRLDPMFDPMFLHCRAMTFKPAIGADPVTFTADWPEHYLELFSGDELEGAT